MMLLGDNQNVAIVSNRTATREINLVTVQEALEVEEAQNQKNNLNSVNPEVAGYNPNMIIEMPKKPQFLSLSTNPTADRKSRSLQSFSLLRATKNIEKLMEAYEEVVKADESPDFFTQVSPVQ